MFVLAGDGTSVTGNSASCYTKDCIDRCSLPYSEKLWEMSRQEKPAFEPAGSGLIFDKCIVIQ